MTLIGNPSAAAEPGTSDLLDADNQLLFYERRLLCIEAYGSSNWEQVVPRSSAAGLFHFPVVPHSWTDLPQPSSRVAIVLSAFGCDWREKE